MEGKKTNNPLDAHSIPFYILSAERPQLTPDPASLERARSISPQKSSPANTPHRGPQPTDRLSLTSSPALESPVPQSDAPEEAMDRPMNTLSISPTKEDDAAPERLSRPTSAASSTPGARPLSWQRRPASQSPDKARSRPLSMVATQNAARTSGVATPEPASVAEEPQSRDRISQALSSKDPAWFRQTADRGLSSPAYRRSQVEEEDRSDVQVSPRRSQLPGMTPRSGAESPAPTPLPLRRSKTGGSISGLMPSPRLDPPAEFESPTRERSSTLERSPTRERSSTLERSPVGRERSSTLERSPSRADGRPVSPTKGMGGFVQSAMMKRSDSVKRWSVASPPGLARADSIASNRTSRIERSGMSSPQATPRSRPGSVIGDRPMTPTRLRNEPEDSGGVEPKAGGQAVADPAPDATSNASAATPPAREGEKDTTPPVSPSKTMDPRRWSPTKSSWLETALNKPDNPKPKPTPAQSNQPAWMVELNKAKAQRANNPESASKPEPAAQKHEVKIGGLMRPTPTGVRRDSTASAASPYSATAASSERGAPSNLKSPVDNPASPSLTSPDTPVEEPAGQSAASTESKSRPQTPTTQVDFRGNLKPRHPPPAGGDAKKGNVNELASVFNNLRKTKTQNYVAPNELKGNILRGKAALSTTGGPKKSEIKDEFKDAILQRKEEFKKAQEEGTGVTPASNTPVEKPLPEGLVRRKTLTRTAAEGGFLPPSNASVENPLHEGLARRKTLTRASAHSRQESVSSGVTKAASPVPSIRDSQVIDPTSTESAITSPTKSAQTPTTDAPTQPVVPAEEPAPSPAAAPKESAAPPRVGARAGNSLADRFNPGLAGLIGRGPPGAGGSKSPGPVAPSPPKETSSGTGGPQLTHATKNRARGPRRKAPSSAAPASAPKGATASPQQAEPSPSPVKEEEKPVDLSAMAPPATSPVTEQPSHVQRVDSPKVSPVDRTPSVDSSAMSPSYNRPFSPYSRRKENDGNSSPGPDQTKPIDSFAMKEASAAATPTHESCGSVSSNSYAGGTPTRERGGSYSSHTSMRGAIASQVAAGAAQRGSPLSHRTSGEKEESKEEPSSPKKLDMKRMSRFLDEQASPAPEPMRDPVKAPSRPSSPVKAPEQPETEVKHRPVSRPLPPPPQERPESKELPPPPFMAKDLPKTPSQQSSPVRDKAAMFGGGAPASPTREPAFGGSERPGLRSRSRSPTKTDRPDPLVFTPNSARVPSPTRSPTRQTLETSQLITDFFGPQRPKREYRADAAEILMRRPPTAEAIKTLSAQRLQIFGDGKMVPVATHNDRVLFEREMYVCSHAFSADSGRRTTEVYFWVGDEVPASDARGAEAVAAREARSIGGRFVVLLQGKETPAFMAALGGVVLTRRGSSNKYDSLAPNVLCGRRYLGCVAFDEVDFSPASLCSGFPYLITQQGRCFLWRGRGADGEEVDCARLVGMDLSLTGALEEVEDGDEPASFWDVFDGGERGVSADHWRLKPGYGKYCCRLFCSDANSKQQVSFSLIILQPKENNQY